MKSMVLKAGTEQDFFQRGKALARLADWRQPMPRERTISFEEPAELLRLLTSSRLDVLRTVKDAPGSITVIAERLQRDRSAVKRDVDQLALAGMVTIETKVLPGHGHMKEVRAVARRFRLEAIVA
ncbi:transcriptional regulator [Pseudorhodoferax sp. Leaf267]|nr:transcriptional regulator [Pseudorhodoferax sp. Leaf267]